MSSPAVDVNRWYVDDFAARKVNSAVSPTCPDATAAQPTLPGVAPPTMPAAPPEADAPKIGVLGRLLGPAVVREVTHHGQPGVQLEVLVQQTLAHHPQAAPLFAALPWPDQGDHYSTHRQAREAAAHLSTGTEVLVLGRGLEPARHLGAVVLRLIHTDAIRRADALQPVALQPTEGDPLAH